MSSSRLARDGRGREVAIITTAGVLLEPGDVLYVLGTEVGAGADGMFQRTGTRTGQPNLVTAARQSNRDPVPVDVAP